MNPAHVQTESRRVGLTAGDVMHHGVLTCPPETPLTTVARMMTAYRVHSVVVLEDREDADLETSLWRVVSDLDLAEAIASGGIEDRTAGGTARGALVSVHPDTPLHDASVAMTRSPTAHLIVIERESGRPLGVLSTLDLATAFSNREPTR